MNDDPPQGSPHDPSAPVHPEPPWAALIETLPAALYIDRLDGTSVWVSPQIEAVVGCTRAEWASGYAVWSQRIHPDDRERVVAKSEEFMRTGGPPSDEYRVVLPDGRVRWIHERSLLLRSRS